MIPTKQAAKLLGISPQYLTRMANAGRVPGAQKIGRDWLFPDQPEMPLLPETIKRFKKALKRG